MLIDKPVWVSHGGSSIYAVDVHPSGLRFATGGNDAKVRIWALGPVLDPAQEAAGPGARPRALAVLGDHATAVNAVRFDGSGRRLASGSDDTFVCIFELRGGGGGGAAPGSLAGSDGGHEVWKVAHQLRGHGQNVTDVAWSPDDRFLASASLDNTVVVWDAATGGRVARLEGHTSYVKGVAWDPVGTYLASAADDASVIIWRREGWTQVKRVTAPFQGGTVSSSFSMRPGWTPDGSALAVCNAFDPDAGVHFSPLIARDTWASDFSLVGHTGAVVVARPNPHLVRGKGGAGPACVIAVGSQDHRLTVWRSDTAKALFVGAKFFKQTVVDVAWTPDGYGLLAVSTDGTLAAFQFEAAELGELLSAEEAARHVAARYGDASARQSAFAETADQIMLEGGGGPRVPVRPGLPTPPAGLGGRLGGGGGGGGAVRGPAVGSLDARLAVANGGGPAPGPSRALALASGGAMPAPPQAARAPAAMTALAPEPDGGGRRGGGRAARGGPAASATILAAPPALARLSVPVPGDLPPAPPGTTARPPHAPPPPPAGVFEAANSTAALGQRPTVALRLTRGGGAEPGWTDTLAGTAAALAASPALAAVATADGTLQVYSRSGRRLLPGIALGAPPAFLAADHPAFPARLLVVTTDGAMRLWDFAPGGGSGGDGAAVDPVAGAVPATLVDASVAPLVFGGSSGSTDPVSIASMRLAGSAGLPLAVLTDMTAAAFHPGLRAWLRVADTAFPGSAYGVSGGAAASAMAGAGDLASAQASAASAGRPGELAPMLALGSAADQSRANLEANLASAAALGSAREYRGWLLAYADFLARTGDEARLREAVGELLGPTGYGGGGGGGGGAGGWAPTFLGLDKRALLRDVLGAVGRHRGCQRFVTEMAALLEHAAPPTG